MNSFGANFRYNLEFLIDIEKFLISTRIVVSTELIK